MLYIYIYIIIIVIFFFFFWLTGRLLNVFFAGIFINICNKLVQLEACKYFYDLLLCIKGDMFILMKFYSLWSGTRIFFEVKILKNSRGVFVLVGQKGKMQRTNFFFLWKQCFFFVGLRSICKKKENWFCSCSELIVLFFFFPEKERQTWCLRPCIGWWLWTSMLELPN